MKCQILKSDVFKMLVCSNNSSKKLFICSLILKKTRKCCYLNSWNQHISDVADDNGCTLCSFEQRHHVPASVSFRDIFLLPASETSLNSPWGLCEQCASGDSTAPPIQSVRGKRQAAFSRISGVLLSDCDKGCGRGGGGGGGGVVDTDRKDKT